jgi:hypothetical protein
MARSAQVARAMTTAPTSDISAPAPSQPPQETIEQARQRLMERYRKAGYAVYRTTLPATPHMEFLRALRPDLVVEGVDEQGQPDRAVIEVRPADSVWDAPDFLALADAITTQPEWRLELLVMPEPKE